MGSLLLSTQPERIARKTRRGCRESPPADTGWRDFLAAFAQGDCVKLKTRTRRQFLQKGAVSASWAAGGFGLSYGQTPSSEGPAPAANPRSYGQRSRFVTGGRLGRSATAFPSLSPLQDSTGIITPS